MDGENRIKNRIYVQKLKLDGIAKFFDSLEHKDDEVFTSNNLPKLGNLKMEFFQYIK